MGKEEKEEEKEEKVEKKKSKKKKSDEKKDKAAKNSTQGSPDALKSEIEALEEELKSLIAWEEDTGKDGKSELQDKLIGCEVELGGLLESIAWLQIKVHHGHCMRDMLPELLENFL